MQAEQVMIDGALDQIEGAVPYPDGCSASRAARGPREFRSRM
jgi:hypothetical protein